MIVDTAGRLQIDDALMQELENLKGELRPQEILLVVDRHDRPGGRQRRKDLRRKS